MAALVDKCATNKHDPLAMFINGISRNTISSYKVTMNDGTTLLSSDSKLASKIEKFCEKLPCQV